MSPKVTLIGFGADDTLWHNERFFQLTQARFVAILTDYCDAPDLMDALLQAEKRNIGQYGFGIKGFVPSMIETALDVTEHRVPGKIIAKLIAAGKTLSRPLIKIEVRKNGGISGIGATWEVTRDWTWKDGYFCRNLYWGGDELRCNCQEVAVKDGRVRFTSDRGAGDSVEFIIK